METDRQTTMSETWQHHLDQRLTSRLLRPLTRPGVIAAEPGRGILERLQCATGGLPLIGRLAQHLRSIEIGTAGQPPIVYAQAVRQPDVAPGEASAPAAPATARTAVPSLTVQPVSRGTAPATAAGGKTVDARRHSHRPAEADQPPGSAGVTQLSSDLSSLATGAATLPPVRPPGQARAIQPVTAQARPSGAPIAPPAPTTDARPSIHRHQAKRQAGGSGAAPATPVGSGSARAEVPPPQREAGELSSPLPPGLPITTSTAASLPAGAATLRGQLEQADELEAPANAEFFTRARQHDQTAGIAHGQLRRLATVENATGDAPAQRVVLPPGRQSRRTVEPEPPTTAPLQPELGFAPPPSLPSPAVQRVLASSSGTAGAKQLLAAPEQIDPLRVDSSRLQTFEKIDTAAAAPIPVMRSQSLAGTLPLPEPHADARAVAEAASGARPALPGGSGSGGPAPRGILEPGSVLPLAGPGVVRRRSGSSTALPGERWPVVRAGQPHASFELADSQPQTLGPAPMLSAVAAPRFGLAPGRMPELAPAEAGRPPAVGQTKPASRPTDPGATTLVNRAVERVAAARAPSTTPAAPPGPAAELPGIAANQPDPQIDMAQVAEQVYDLLVRRLAAEREQRGW